MTLHGREAVPSNLGELVTAWIRDRVAGAPLGRTATAAELSPLFRDSITPGGLGAEQAWQRFTERVVPNTVGIDSERFLAFIPVSPSAASVWMDAAVGAASFSAESWLEAAGAVAAENEVLRWLAQCVGLPTSAGGCFMSGGSIGNLSAMAVAREAMGDRRTVAVADTVHASVHNALHLLGLADVLVVPTHGRCTGEALGAAVGDRSDVGMVIASAGSTNAGVVDDLDGIADVCERIGAWLHVDAAYGGAGLLLPELRPLFAGIERVDSLIIDPHKWLFAPAGSCAVLYRDPAKAAAVHTQRGPYLDVLHNEAEDVWNPSDYGFQLTRRASGLPMWFALAAHGVEAHANAVRAGMRLAALAAQRLAQVPAVQVLMPPQLSVVLFRRSGWGAPEWGRWARSLLADGVAFVAPTTWRGEAMGRLVFLHPHTPVTVIDEIAASLGG